MFEDVWRPMCAWVNKSPTAANGGFITRKVAFDYFSAALTQNKYKRAHEQTGG